MITDDYFDTSMGSLDSRVWDILGLFILYNINAYDGIHIDRIGLYMYDGLMIMENSTKLKVDRIKKTTSIVFQSFEYYRDCFPNYYLYNLIS